MLKMSNRKSRLKYNAAEKSEANNVFFKNYKF